MGLDNLESWCSSMAKIIKAVELRSEHDSDTLPHLSSYFLLRCKTKGENGTGIVLNQHGMRNSQKPPPGLKCSRIPLMTPFCHPDTHLESLAAHKCPAMLSRSKMFSQKLRKAQNSSLRVTSPWMIPHAFQGQEVGFAQPGLNQLLLPGYKLPGLIMQANQARSSLTHWQGSIRIVKSFSLLLTYLKLNHRTKKPLPAAP